MNCELLAWMITDMTNYVYIGVVINDENCRYCLRTIDDVLRDYYDTDTSILHLKFYTKNINSNEVADIIDVVNKYKQKYEPLLNVRVNRRNDYEIRNSKNFPDLLHYVNFKLKFPECEF